VKQATSQLKILSYTVYRSTLGSKSFTLIVVRTILELKKDTILIKNFNANRVSRHTSA